MQVRCIKLENFRGVRSGEVNLAGNSLLVGGNAVGKSTVCEALDLVLGPERLFRRPVVDEYDFYAAAYRAPGEGAVAAPTIRIEVVLTDLSDLAARRFHAHLRRWDANTKAFVDADPSGEALDSGEWCLPVVFLARYNEAEDDFEGGTFFLSPQLPVDDLTADALGLGAGMRPFTREDKRVCGFLYLRAVRTGTRALGFGRGSLIDTIVRLESENTSSLLSEVIGDLGELTLAEDNEGLSHLRTQLRARVEQFLPLSRVESPLDVKASDLTREHVRDVMRLFLATQPGNNLVPFGRLSTGSVNVLVFALLTYIAEVAGEQQVIFAMEEPEIALPPHTQRRMVDFVSRTMGQTIITSHSPYVIERFGPEHIVTLKRDDSGELSSSPVTLPPGIKLKRYRENRRQFAEAVLSRGVLVVEGATEATVLAMAADLLDGEAGYEHPDSAGISIFDAGGDAAVTQFGPMFADMRKATFGFHDKPKVPFTADQQQATTCFDVYQPTSYLGIEELLTTEMPQQVIDRFLSTVSGRSDNPQPDFTVDTLDEAARRTLAMSLLKKRKGGPDGYAAVLVAECADATQLPTTIAGFLRAVNAFLKPPVAQPPADQPAE